MPNVMIALTNISGALCSEPLIAGTHYLCSRAVFTGRVHKP